MRLRVMWSLVRFSTVSEKRPEMMRVSMFDLHNKFILTRP